MKVEITKEEKERIINALRFHRDRALYFDDDIAFSNLLIEKIKKVSKCR